MSQYDGLSFHSQVMVLRKNVELVHPVSERVAVSSATRNGIRNQAKRKAALHFVVDRAQANLVVAFRNRPVVSKFRCVYQMISIHSTTT
jgi:hypothetical protein